MEIDWEITFYGAFIIVLLCFWFYQQIKQVKLHAKKSEKYWKELTKCVVAANTLEEIQAVRDNMKKYIDYLDPSQYSFTSGYLFHKQQLLEKNDTI